MRPLFIASLGNKPFTRYDHTFHSAGHLLLVAIHRSIAAPTFHRDPQHADAFASHAPDNLLLWKSPSMMNNSGNALSLAWSRFRAKHSASPSAPLDPFLPSTPAAIDQPHLVILHDELDLPLGRCTIKTGAGRSARGHNGLKSVLSKPSLAELEFTRVGIGIGPRPESKDPAVVAEYVLNKMSLQERQKVQELAWGVWGVLQEFRVLKSLEGVSRMVTTPK